MARNRGKQAQKKNCENCGKPDELEFFEYVLNGITLCQDCADLPTSKINKNNFTVNWTKIKGEYYPSDYPISKRKDKENAK